MRFPMTAVFLLAVRVAFAAGGDYSARLQGEYRRDAVDFEEKTREFHRERIFLKFSEKSAASAAHTRDTKTGISRGTWNIFLRDLGPNFSFAAGNFHAHFGKGLLLGKRSAWQPDLFSRRGSIHEGDTFIPCNSGNPYFAFNGVAFEFGIEGDDISFSLRAFYSLRERHATQEEYESRGTAASGTSMENRDRRDRLYIEPVHIHTPGALLAANLFGLLTVQAYGLGNGVFTPRGDSFSVAGGAERFAGGGFTAEYRDDFIALFFERVTAQTRFYNDDGSSASNGGSAYLGGMGLMSSCVRLSLIWKDADQHYYSPYGASVGEYTGTGLFLDGTLTPRSFLKIGVSASSERKTATGPRDHERPMAKRECAFVDISHRWLELCRFEAAVSSRSGNDPGARRRWRQRLAVRPWKFLSLSFTGTYLKRSGSAASRTGTAAVSAHYRRTSSLSLSITRAFIAEGNPAYESLLPLRNSRIPGSFIRESGFILAGKMTLAMGGVYFSARAARHLTQAECENTVAELFASGTF